MFATLRKLHSLGAILAYSLLAATASAQPPATLWQPIGPWGGDARTFAAVPGDPGHLYLGDENNWVFETTDGGDTWTRVGRLDAVDDFVVDSLLVDAADHRNIFAGVWRSDHPDGGLFVSRDAGRTWHSIPALAGQSIRSLAQAPSNPDELVAGSLEGVFRSLDHGQNWERISPPSDDPLSREIHEVESLAIDPRQPDTIYAGTWHLPWKTTDGGRHWLSIKQGVIDDSDVFSIIIDPVHPAIVYASACSGIYKSESAGTLFRKVQGIPSTARRTRVLYQDPRQHETVYAGTTEGLYRTRDGGHEWKLLTLDDVIVNDVALGPNGRILIATDRGGVMASDDDGVSFHDSNVGFSARQVQALVVDSRASGHLYAGVVNDKRFGGVYETDDLGAHWHQVAEGLDGRDIFDLEQAEDGTILAGTSHGLFQLSESDTARWNPIGSIENSGYRIVSTEVGGRKVNRQQPYSLPARPITGRVFNMDLHGTVWAIAGEDGVLTSGDHGITWQGNAVFGSADFREVVVLEDRIVAARASGLAYTTNSGLDWNPMRLPTRIRDVHALATTPDGSLWVGTKDGVYLSRDKGEHWFWLDRLRAEYTDALRYDIAHHALLATSRATSVVWAIDPATLSFTRVDTGYRLFQAQDAGQKRVAATLGDGLVMEP